MPSELQNWLEFPGFLIAGVCFLQEPLDQGCSLVWLWLVGSLPSKSSTCFAGLSPRSRLASWLVVCMRVCVCVFACVHRWMYRPRILNGGNMSPRGIKLVLEGWKILLCLYIKHKYTHSTSTGRQYICGINFSWGVNEGKKRCEKSP